MITDISDDLGKLFEREEELETVLDIIVPLICAARRLHRELMIKGYRSEALGDLYDSFAGLQFMEEGLPELAAMCRGFEAARREASR